MDRDRPKGNKRGDDEMQALPLAGTTVTEGVQLPVPEIEVTVNVRVPAEPPPL